MGGARGSSDLPPACASRTRARFSAAEAAGRPSLSAHRRPSVLLRQAAGGRGPAESSQNAKTSCFVLDRMTSQSYKHTYRIYQTIFAYGIHHTSVLRGRLVKRALILHVALFLSAHDGRCSRHPRLPDLRPPRGDPLAPRRRGSHARRARGFRPRLRRGTPGTTRRSPSSLEEAMFSMRTDDRPARVVRRPSSLTPDRPLHHHEHRSRPRRPAAKSRSRRSPR